MTREEKDRAHTIFMRAYFALKRRGYADNKAYRAAYLKGYGKARFEAKMGGSPRKGDRDLLAKVRVPLPKMEKPKRKRK